MAQDFAKRKQPSNSKKPPVRRKAQAQRHTGEPQPRGKSFRMFMTGMLARMVSMVKSPWDLLSSGTRAMPAAIALSGEGCSFRPLKTISPSYVSTP